MEVRLFGELEAVEAGVPVPVRGTKQRALLALLALQPGEAGQRRPADRRAVGRRAGRPTRPTPCRPRSASCAVPSARRRSSPPKPGYALDAGPDDLDVIRFEQLVAKGRRLLEEGETALASSTLGEALQLRRGEPLSRFALCGLF